MTNYEMDEERRREKRAREIATWRVREQSPQSDLQECFKNKWPAQYDPQMRYTEGDVVPPADFDCVEALTKAKSLISRVIEELMETRKGDAERS